MDYIVNPSLFYWVEVFNVIASMLISAILVMLIVIAISFYFYHDNYWGWNDKDEDAIAHRKRIKKFIIILIIFILLAIFIPSGETLVKMYIARLATGSNVELVIQKIIDVAQEIIKAFK